MVTTKLLRSKADAATSLGVSLRKVDQLIADGRLKVVRIGRRVLVTDESLGAFVGHSTCQDGHHA